MKKQKKETIASTTSFAAGNYLNKNSYQNRKQEQHHKKIT